MSLLPFFLLGGAVLLLTRSGEGGTRKEGVATPSSPSPSGSPGEIGMPKPSFLDDSGNCIKPEQKDLMNLPDDPFWNAYKYALYMDSDPKSLEEFAEACRKVCQPIAAQALDEKARALRSVSIPDGYNPNGAVPAMPPIYIPGLSTPIPVPTGFDPTGLWSWIPPASAGVPASFPTSIPFAEATSDPTEATTVPVALPGLRNFTEETPTGLFTSAARSGCQSSPDTQWWSGPFKPGEDLLSFAKFVTGDARRVADLISANPEKASVGSIDKPGYTFASLKYGERIRIPKSWNVFVDERGRVDGGGARFPVCS